MKNLYRFLPLLLAGGATFGQTAKLGPTLQHVDPNSTVQVIVQFAKDPTDAQHQKVVNKGGYLKGALHSVRGGAYSVPASSLADLAKDPSVMHVSEDHKLSAKLDYVTAATNAVQAWQQFGVDGTGIGVAVIDSGFTPQVEFSGPKTGSRVIYGQDFTGGDGTDHYGHGEHISGIIAGNAHNSECNSCTRQFKGMAPNANLINLRVLDQNGEATDSEVIAAIETAIQLKSK